jgi:PEP-CTERM motif
MCVTNARSGTIGEQTTSGATVTAALISGLDEPAGIAIASIPATVPEPGSFPLLALALAVLGFCLRKRTIGS